MTGPELECLTLLATASEKPEWNSRHRSQGHQVIPLVSEAAVARIPMIAQLIKSFELEPGAVFSKVSVPAPSARLLKSLPLNLKMVISPFDNQATFTPLAV